MTPLLDEKDIIISRLNSKIERLEKDNAVFVDRSSTLHDHLEKARTELKVLAESERKNKQLQKDYERLYRTLHQIASGEIENPVALAKAVLKNIDD